jgi:hypothetical protein
LSLALGLEHCVPLKTELVCESMGAARVFPYPKRTSIRETLVLRGRWRFIRCAKVRSFTRVKLELVPAYQNPRKACLLSRCPSMPELSPPCLVV